MVLLDDADMAYMRETQAEVRPTAANLFRRTTKTSDGMGGWTYGQTSTSVPIQVRVASQTDNVGGDNVPTALADKYDVADLVKVITDLVTMSAGDRLYDTDRGRWYDVVADAEPLEWTTAQAVWAVRGTVTP